MSTAGLMVGAISAFLVWACAPTVSAEEFYKGKTIRFVVGHAAGGGFDV